MRRLFPVALLSLLVLTGCLNKDEDNEWEKLPKEEQSLFFLNEFAYNMMSTYYLWNDEIKDGLSSWAYNTDPVAKVRSVRYKDAEGSEIDKWTQMTDDYEGFQGKVAGNTSSTGMDVVLYYSDESHANVVLVVSYVYAGSPAAAAGLKRGDIIVAVNGHTITPDNYKSLLSSTILSGGTTVLTMDDGHDISLTARQMYLDPVNCYKVLEKDGRKIGYLHYTSFTLKSCEKLINVFKGFKAAGVTELVLDLRYNSGGYSRTSEVLASMIVPIKEVENGSVYQQDIYNSILTAAWKENKTLFGTEFNVGEDDGEKVMVSTEGANLNISKLHVIMTASGTPYSFDAAFFSAEHDGSE